MEKVIVTVGPALFKDEMLKRVHNSSYIYRINGAHGSIDDIKNNVLFIRSEIPEAQILIDLPGNKVRTKNINLPIKLQVGTEFTLTNKDVNYSNFFDHLKIGDTIWANDSTLKFEVLSVNSTEVQLLSHSCGDLKTNKGLHVRGIHKNIPFFFEKDLELIQLAKDLFVSHVGLSFVRDIDDINLAKSLIDTEIQIIPKVETLSAVENLDEIIKSVDVINVDRGDLSTDVGIEKIYSYQKFIIERANLYHKKVFLATQFFMNMVEKPVPTIAEINDFHSCIKLGIYGIQLSEETAIGLYPKEVLNVVNNVVSEIKLEKMNFAV